MSNWKKGDHPSPETEFKKGHKGYWLGKKNPLISMSRSIFMKGNKYAKGKTWKRNPGSRENEEERRKKISESLKGKQIGSNGPNWKGGITPLQKSIRNLEENKKWIKDVFNRDGYTCQECLKVGCKLEAHHKVIFKDLFKSFLENYSQFSPIEDIETLTRIALSWRPFWDINNGITLCKKCHINIHRALNCSDK